MARARGICEGDGRGQAVGGWGMPQSTGPTRCAPARPQAASGAAPPPKFYVLRYDYVADILEKRGPFREAHLKGAQVMVGAGPAAAGARRPPHDAGAAAFTLRASPRRA